jgi:hypothetical protein
LLISAMQVQEVKVFHRKIVRMNVNSHWFVPLSSGNPRRLRPRREYTPASFPPKCAARISPFFSVVLCVKPLPFSRRKNLNTESTEGTEGTEKISHRHVDKREERILTVRALQFIFLTVPYTEAEEFFEDYLGSRGDAAAFRRTFCRILNL